MKQSSTGIPVISHLFSDIKARNTAMAIYVSCAPIGTILGVVLGALLTGKFIVSRKSCPAYTDLANHAAIASPVGWRSTFWVVLILAGLVTILAFALIPKFDLAKHHAIDYLGMGTFISGTCLFIYGLNDAERLGWKSPAIIVTLVLGGLLLISFPFIEHRVAKPVLPANILFNSRVIIPLTTFAITGGCWVTWFYVATQTALNSLHYSTILAACYFLPATAAAIIGGGIGNSFVQKDLAKVTIIGGYVIGLGALVP